MTNHAAINSAALFKYGFIAMPLAFAGLPLYIHAPDFYTREFGLSIGLLGVILLGIRLFDAVQDPVLGFLSDKFARYRLALLYLGAIILGTGMVGLFGFSPDADSAALWFALHMVLATSGFSLLTINLNMIGGFWVNDSTERTRITSTREALGLSGLLLAAVFPTVMSRFVSDQQAYASLAMTFVVFLVIGMALLHLFLKGLSESHPIKQGYGRARWTFFRLFTGEQQRYFLVCFLSYLAASIPAVLVLFFIRDYLQAEAWTPLFLICYFLAGAAVMPAWYALSKRAGKAETWLLSMLLAVVTFVWAFTLQPGDIVSYTLICLFSGFALGADLALPPSIIADRIEQQQDEAYASQYFALLALLPKVAIAVASGGAFLVLDQLGFVAGEDNSAQALSGLILLYAIVPCLIKLLSAVFLWRDIQSFGGSHAHQASH